MSFSVWFRFQTRGAIFFLIGVVTLLLFDHDEKVGHMSDHESEHSFLSAAWNLNVSFIYLHARWELLQAIQVFVVVFMWQSAN